LSVCSVFHAWILELMPQMILDFKSKTWETMQWQSAVYFKLGFQIPCLRSSSILNPRPGKPQIGSLHCISSLDFMPQIILDFKSKTWQTTDWQSAVYFLPGFQIPCLRASPILNPRPGKPQIGSLQCISCLDFRAHASDHPRF